MNRAENYEILGKSPMQAKYALSASLRQDFDIEGNLEILTFEDRSRLNVQSWNEASMPKENAMYKNEKKWLLFENYGRENQVFCCDYETYERACEAQKGNEKDGMICTIMLNKNGNPTAEY